ncbi:MAG TPA: dihydrodipicolinate synthase family protein [Solirubrobacteraceae bacterium]|jgi:4-hydroxy-tetrahydrodipicolinate synthase|nr:dihydrodipicolinate synthase family protein [Solirubrobacteraceae bacterium]
MNDTQHSPAWRGIFPSLPTPFTDSGDIDLAAQREVTRFALDQGSHGLICFGLAGEVFRLTPDERIELLRVIVAETNGAVPVLAGVGTEATHGSVRLAKAAAEAGADGLVVPPPLTSPASKPALIRYFQEIAAATDLPVMIQDAPEYLTVELGPEVVAEMLESIPNLAAVKLEVGANGLASWVSAFGDRVKLFCGSGGLYLLDCLEQGAAGVAPGVDLVDQLVDIYELWSSDRRPEARERMRAVLSMLVFQMQTIEHYNATAKYVLCKRGVLSVGQMREPAVQLDDVCKTLLDRHMAELGLSAITS